MNFKNKKILVVGFGASGRAAVRFFLREGARVAVTDIARPTPPGSFGPLECHWGGHPPGIFEERDLIVVSPGVSLTLPGIRLAFRRRIPVIGEFGLAAELLKSPMIAVTGTNGKSTTVTLIARMLEAAGKKTTLAGNIGRPLLDVVMDGKKYDWIVAEVSSFQLETVAKFHPRVGVILNVTPDHLDRYPSFRKYARAKFRIFKEQGPKDLLIYNEEDLVVKKGVRRARAKKIGFSGKHFSAPSDRVRLVGLHNRDNMMAAALSARFAGVPEEKIREVIENFEGLPHRTEFVREVRGVRYYDDSKGTNVDAAVKSLAGFPDKRVILIAGGRDKGGGYVPLREMAGKKAKLLVLIGEAGGRIERAMGKKIPVEIAGRLEEAVRLAAERSEAGDTVLLSPACSSFDQFRDYKERGEKFQKLVKEL